MSPSSGHRPPAGLHQRGVDDVGKRRLAGTGQAGEEDGDALPAAAWVDTAQFLDDLRVAEPLGHVLAGQQQLAQLGLAQRHRLKSLGAGLFLGKEGLPGRYVVILWLWDDFDADVSGEVPQKLLCLVLAVKRSAPFCVPGGRGVVRTHKEVGAAVVSVDQRMPQGLPRPGHAHRQWQQRQGGHLQR
jgi:hypothetical protein